MKIVNIPIGKYKSSVCPMVISIMTGLLLAGLSVSESLAEWRHAIAMHGKPALPEDLEHLPYASPDAKQGGSIILGETGSFDSLNPFILKGRAPWGVRAHVFESLMFRSHDEPFTLYGLLAEAVDVPDDRSWVSFRLNHSARFSDGSPVTIDDVEFSMQTLRDYGRPNYRRYYSNIGSVERPDPHSIKFIFKKADRELPLLMGLMPILKKAQWEGKDFAKSNLEPPIGSGSYLVGDFEAGRYINFVRNPDYWGNHLPIKRGIDNFAKIRYLYFRDSSALFEAFKVGKINLFREGDPLRWKNEYDFQAAANGDVIHSEIHHGRPSGMYGLVFNSRRQLFSDPKVRQALTMMLDFEWINQRFFGSAYQRTKSYFDNSELGFAGAADAGERALLAETGANLPKTILDSGPPAIVSDGSGRDRRKLRQAKKLLKEAGWLTKDGTLRNENNQPFGFEILLRSSSEEKVANIFVNALKTLGISASTRLVDEAQYTARLQEFDYDMIVHRWWLSLSPGNEQHLYWSSSAAKQAGSRNYMGVSDHAVDFTIDKLVQAVDKEELLNATRALDRLLTNGYYVIPYWHLPMDMVAHWSYLHKPKTDALYGWRPEVWWRE